MHNSNVKLYPSIDGNPVKNPVAFCHFMRHKGYLTEAQIKVHGCISRKCGRLQKLDCPYWAERRERKVNAKAARRKLAERAL